eukprot:snap_masked-scaffold_38-processed-gene-2.36-mRNA-1 protein AED:1.00 eAED:1.00 QI:0/-1/0/0/-1/1/1/0/208
MRPVNNEFQGVSSPRKQSLDSLRQPQRPPFPYISAMMASSPISSISFKGSILNYAFDRRTKGTFSPFHVSELEDEVVEPIEETEEEEKEKSALYVDTVISVENKKQGCSKFELPKRRLKFILFICCSYLTFLLVSIAYGVFDDAFQEYENNEEEEIIIDEKEDPLFPCETIEGELNRFLIRDHAHLTDNLKTLELFNLNISCFPLDSL